MSAYTPPTETLPIFDPAVFQSGDEALTSNIADLNYLKFPYAQGLENLQAVNVNGVATFNANTIINNQSLDIDGASGQIRYTDNTTQVSAYTGGGALAGSYTLSNITLDANGKITGISSGSSGSQFVPTFYNASVLQVGTTGYTALQYINFTGGWGVNDLITFRVVCNMLWGNYGSGQWSQFASVEGLMYIYPYAMPGGVFSSTTTSSNINWGNNSGTYCGWGSGKIVNFNTASSQGNLGYMNMYGSGTQNGGYLQFFFPSPGSTWNVSISIEYLFRTGSGGGFNITSGATYGQPAYYNALPTS